MDLSFSSEIKKNIVFNTVEKYLIIEKLNVIKSDTKRPWGGFFVIEEQQSKKFIEIFFGEISYEDFSLAKKISPKILIVEPGKKLSFQYHHRRAELWKIIGEQVGIVASESDEETEMKRYKSGSIIQLKKGERHRLIGLDSWGVVAEIWQHTDDKNPSDEDDIIRLQDDFGR
jgi:mannose-6-phosphate isomerase-like protein (cupin superfamily)